MGTKRLHIDRTENSPGIDLDLEQGSFTFVGRSLPPNSEQFFSRVHRWLEEYLKQPKPTTVDIRMDYLDTSSSKHFYRIFDRLHSAHERGVPVKVNWHYETGDEEMIETGKDLQGLFDLDFSFIEERELF